MDLLKIEKQALSNILSTIIPVSEEVTLYPHEKGLCVDERNESNVMGVKGIYELKLLEPLLKPIKFNVSTLKSWLAFINEEVTCSINKDKLTFHTEGKKRHNIPLQLVDEDEQPKITIKPYPIVIETNSLALTQAINELSSVGESLEITLEETLILASFNESYRTETPLEYTSTTELDAKKPAIYNYDLVKSVMPGISTLEKVELWWGWIEIEAGKPPQPLPLVITGKTEKIKVSYGISPRML